jgi:hypothetical protein
MPPCAHFVSVFVFAVALPSVSCVPAYLYVYVYARMYMYACMCMHVRACAISIYSACVQRVPHGIQRCHPTLRSHTRSSSHDLTLLAGAGADVDALMSDVRMCGRPSWLLAGRKQKKRANDLQMTFK